MLRICRLTAAVLFAMLLCSCHADKRTEFRAAQALHDVAAHYRSERSICDSLLDVASSYYLPELAKGDTTLSSLTSSPQQAECMLYEGIRHHDRAQQQKPDIEAYAAEMAKAYRLFLEVEHNIGLLAEPYLKGVICHRMAMINVKNENYHQALPYFRQELNHAFHSNDTSAIALAYSHLAYSFYTLDDGDSALYYSDSALYLAPHLDSRALASVYANTTYYQQLFGLRKDRSNLLLSQIPFEKCTQNDSCRIFIIIADCYMEQGNYGKADSLLQWTIAHSEGRPEILSMSYLRRANMFEQLGKYDSALVQRKAREEQLTILRQSELRKEAAEAHGRYERIQQQHHHELVVTIIVIIALLFIVFLLLMWIRRIQKMKRLELHIADINATMDQYVADYQSQKEIYKRREANHNQQETSLYIEINKSKNREKELKKKLNVLRSENRSSHIKIESMLRRFYLLSENAPWPESIYEKLLAIFRDSYPKRKKLYDELDKIGLSPRHKVICILMSDDRYEPDKIWIYAGCANMDSFQATKSQIKRKLIEANSPSKEIQDLLSRFPLDRGPSEKMKPLKKEGEK